MKVNFWLPITIVIISVSSGWSQYVAIFSSSVYPEIPTEQDSVVIETRGFYSYGSLLGSSHAQIGNEFLVDYLVRDTIINRDYRSLDQWQIGKLPIGNYSIITSSGNIQKRLNPSGPGYIFDTLQYKDTFNFQIVPVGTSIPKIISWRYKNQLDDNFYLNVNDTYPKCSYYYWNDDTLSIAAAFATGGSGYRFQLRSAFYRDTLSIYIIDTSIAYLATLDKYLIVASLFPVTKGVFPITINYKGVTPVSMRFTTDKYLQLSVDYRAKGIGLGFKKAGIPEFILYPDSILNRYYIFSPFLDSAKLLSIQPNPHYQPLGMDSMIIGTANYEYKLMQKWTSFNKSEWNYVRQQSADSLFFDTTTIWGSPSLNLRYSNKNNDTVTSYITRNLDTIRAALTPDPFVGISLLLKNPKDSINSVVNGGSHRLIRPEVIQVHAFRNSLRFSVQGLNQKVWVEDVGRIEAVIIDLQGRDIYTFNNPTFTCWTETVIFTWDRQNDRGVAVAGGMYLFKVCINNTIVFIKPIVLH